MRFECKVRVVNRNPGGRSGTFYLKSTIALGKETNTVNDYFLLHFSNITRGSMKGSRYTKYSLKRNPTKVFTRCLNEGKITISFEDPPHDLFIQGEVLQLSNFMELLNTCLTGEADALPPSSTSTNEARERYNKHAFEEQQVILDQTEAMNDSTEAIHDTTEAMHDSTEAMHDSTEAMHDSTEAMHDSTEAMHDEETALCSKQLEELHL